MDRRTAALSSELAAQRDLHASLIAAHGNLHKDEEAPAAAAAKSVEQLEPLLAVQTERSTSAEAGLKPSEAHQVCKA